MSLAPDDPRHGTYNGYNNLLCRCNRCRKAAADHMRHYTHRTGRRRPMSIYLAERRAQEPPPHGTAARYNNQGCRCAECKEASRLAKRAWRAKRVAAGFPYA
jgi:hypothetical protein